MNIERIAQADDKNDLIGEIMLDFNGIIKNSTLGRIAEAIFQTFIPGYKKNKDITNIKDKDVVDRIIKCAEIFDINGYKVKRIHATDLKSRDTDNKLFITMEFELQKE